MIHYGYLAYDPTSEGWMSCGRLIGVTSTHGRVRCGFDGIKCPTCRDPRAPLVSTPVPMVPIADPPFTF